MWVGISATSVENPVFVNLNFTPVLFKLVRMLPARMTCFSLNLKKTIGSASWMSHHHHLRSVVKTSRTWQKDVRALVRSKGLHMYRYVPECTANTALDQLSPLVSDFSSQSTHQEWKRHSRGQISQETSSYKIADSSFVASSRRAYRF